MKFEFAVATDITEFAKKNYPDTYNDYEKVYITTGTNDYHVLRVLKGHNEDYDIDPDSHIVEHLMIPKLKMERITSLNKLNSILEEDDGSNYDYGTFKSINECIEHVDGGFGINL